MMNLSGQLISLEPVQLTRQMVAPSYQSKGSIRSQRQAATCSARFHSSAAASQRTFCLAPNQRRDLPLSSTNLRVSLLLYNAASCSMLAGTLAAKLTRHDPAAFVLEPERRAKSGADRSYLNLDAPVSRHDSFSRAPFHRAPRPTLGVPRRTEQRAIKTLVTTTTTLCYN